MAQWDTVTVEVGQELTFVDRSTIGRSDKRNWNIAGGVPAVATDSAANVAFYTMGVATGSSIEVLRTGSGVPAGSASKWIPLIVKVVQSSQTIRVFG